MEFVRAGLRVLAYVVLGLLRPEHRALLRVYFLWRRGPRRHLKFVRSYLFRYFDSPFFLNDIRCGGLLCVYLVRLDLEKYQ